jgi:hypothetical protein
MKEMARISGPFLSGANGGVLFRRRIRRRLLFAQKAYRGPGMVPVRLGGLTFELSVVLVPLLLMLLIMPSEPFVRPAAALMSLPGAMAPGVVVPALLAPGTSVPFPPSVTPSPACA